MHGRGGTVALIAIPFFVGFAKGTMRYAHCPVCLWIVLFFQSAKLR